MTPSLCKHDRPDPVVVPSEAVDQCPSLNIPDVHDPVECGGDKAIIGRDSNTRHPPRIACDRKRLRFASVHIPYPHCLVVRARDDERTIMREVEGEDSLLVAFERVDDALTGDVPYL